MLIAATRPLRASCHTRPPNPERAGGSVHAEQDSPRTLNAAGYRPTQSHHALLVSEDCGSHTGAGILEGFLADSTAGRLSFEQIDIDQAFVHHAQEQLDEIVNAFSAAEAVPTTDLRRLWS